MGRATVQVHVDVFAKKLNFKVSFFCLYFLLMKWNSVFRNKINGKYLLLIIYVYFMLIIKNSNL